MPSQNLITSIVEFTVNCKVTVGEKRRLSASFNLFSNKCLGLLSNVAFRIQYLLS